MIEAHSNDFNRPLPKIPFNRTGLLHIGLCVSDSMFWKSMTSKSWAFIHCNGEDYYRRPELVTTYTHTHTWPKTIDSSSFDKAHAICILIGLMAKQLIGIKWSTNNQPSPCLRGQSVSPNWDFNSAATTTSILFVFVGLFRMQIPYILSIIDDAVNRGHWLCSSSAKICKE